VLTNCVWVQLELDVRETKAKLETSEMKRLAADEEAETSRRLYESEISLLKMQMSTFEEDFNAEKRAHEDTINTLEQLRIELHTAQAQASCRTTWKPACIAVLMQFPWIAYHQYK